MAMEIYSAHQRKIKCCINDAETLIDTICMIDSILWPAHLWPRDNFNKEKPQIGAVGGHGGTRYVVSEYTPSRHIKFEFISPKNYRGFHRFSLEEENDRHIVFSHLTKINTSLYRYLLWNFMIRWVHDALITDAFDQAESKLTGSIVSSKWYWHVYLIRHILGTSRLLTHFFTSFFTAKGTANESKRSHKSKFSN